jgi:hypothetical protein
LTQCGRFQLKAAEARRIVDEVKSVVATWEPEFAGAGISGRDRAILASCIDVDR